ncbi:RanBP2-type zinc finger protein [Vitis vinifera]|uniref:RanBP2-type zinc finger protein n=1 Tax=Vitis vinifera TaxID=29760 RepID=A0A438HJ55_VITVI|nr:RanBP2-type zinc finger protein [Vitis vinifera]
MPTEKGSSYCTSAPITSPYNHPPPFYFGGVGAPPPMPLGGPSRYGPPIPVPGMHYDYSPGNVHGPYGLLTTFPLELDSNFVSGSTGQGAVFSRQFLRGVGLPKGNKGLCNVPKWFDCFVEAGMGYGSGLLSVDMDLAFRDPHGLEEACQMALPLENVVEVIGFSQLILFKYDLLLCGPDGLSEGDWVCPKCDNVNFAFRTTCNMKKCGAARPSSGPSRSDSGAPEGSWTCSKCENLNYPFRTVCNRKGCGNEKPASDE